MTTDLLNQFKNIASINNIEVKNYKDVEKEFEKLGYKGEKYFHIGTIGIIKAIGANAKEANALIDVSIKEKLGAALDSEILYILIDKNYIRENMYEIYSIADKNNYLLFIGAESKTADIEKQLVSGVQGAKKLIFVLI